MNLLNTITINDNKFTTSGTNICINNGKVIVNGVVIQDGLSGVVDVKFEGDLASLDCNGSATVKGNIKGNADIGGSLDCAGNIGGSIDCGGSVNCGSVGGDIDAGGSVRCSR